MEEVRESKSWRDELASLVEDTGIRFTSDDGIGGIAAPSYEAKKFEFQSPEYESEEGSESLQDQIKGFAKAWGEMVIELGKGFKDVIQQTVLTEDSYIMKKTSGPLTQVSEKLRFLNEFLPEDRDPAHAWPVIFFVFILALAALGVKIKDHSSVSLVKRVYIPPPSAVRIQLPDGRYLAYQELGVPSERARFSLIVPHSFVSSRLAGIPGVKLSLLEEFGIRLVTYDRPGFGESDPNPERNLNSSALDMLYLADSIGIKDKFWVLGYSDGAIHAWGALNYIPHRIAGAAMFAPLVNPYDSSMTKEEISRIWQTWTRRRRLMFYFARRFPKLLKYLYRRTFLSGKHGQIDKWLSLSLGEKDKALIKKPGFEELWQRNMEESIRQGNTRPFLEEAVLQVSHWGFSLADLQVQKKCPGKSFFPWLKFFYTEAECETTGFLGPVHIWQGMEDLVVPPTMTDYILRVLPSAIVHRLPEEGHYSYFYLCDKCHREIFSTLFGIPQGPLDLTEEEIPQVLDHEEEEASTFNHTVLE